MSVDNYDDMFTEEVDEPCPEGAGVTLDDFVAYMPSHVYVFTPCREIWTGSSVNSRVPPIPVLGKNGQPKRDENGKKLMIRATTWLDRNRAVEQMTWCPGLPMLIKDRLIVDGGWIERKDVTCLNLYRPPRIELGDAAKAGPWLGHLNKLFERNDARHILCWLAHRVQSPQVKINHALVLGGEPGIGKDMLLEPVKQAVGPWNFHDVSPGHLLGRFNAFAKSVILRCNEAHDLGNEIDRFGFYEHTKIYCAAPPDVLRVDEKHIREHYVLNVLGFLITTNHKTDGIYLPAEDRRHYVAWSSRKKDDFTPDYWNTLARWYSDGGYQHVAAYLAELDLSQFDAKAPPPKTDAFWSIVGANTASEDAELEDVLDALGRPDAVTLKHLIAAATGEAAAWLVDRKNRRAIPHRMDRCGYVPVRNPGAKDGLWKLQEARQVIYAKAELPEPARITAARQLLTVSDRAPVSESQ